MTEPVRIPILFRASLGFVARHPWQLLLALLGITIGVAVVLAVDIANASARAAFTRSLDTLAGQSTHQIVAGPNGVDEALYVELKLAAGDVYLAPIVEGAVEVEGVVLSVLGVDPMAERAFRTYTLPTAANSSGAAPDAARELSRLRRFLTVPGGVLATAATRRSLGVQADTPFPVVAGGRQREGQIVGEIDANETQYRDLLIVDIATAQEWFDSAGYLSRIDVRASEAGAAALSRSLPAGAQLLPASLRNQTTTEMTSAFMTNLTAMSLLALLVGVFLIYNSVGFAVVQRRGLLGVLRALGLSRRQTFALILTESAMLACVGVLLGVVVGVALGERLLLLVSQSINDLFFRVAVTDVSVDVVSLAKAVVAGVGVTLIAALVPAVEAAGQQPALALRRSTLERGTDRVLPWLVAAGVVTAACGAAILAASRDSLILGLVALFALVFGAALCIPAAVRAATAVLTPLANRLGGTVARLAVDGIRASLSRTGVAIVALAIAVSATIGVSVMVDSFRGAVERWLDGTLPSDVYVGVAAGTVDAGLIADIAGLPAVDEISTSRRAWVQGRAGQTRIVALGMAARSYAGTEILDTDPALAWAAFDRDGAVLVSTPYAYRHGVGVGDEVEVLTSGGYRRFPIAGVYRSYEANQGAVLMSRDTYDRYWADRSVDSVGIYFSAGADPEQVIDDIRALSEDRQALRLASRSALTEISLGIFDRTFIITNVLYWLAVCVAIIGILGAMLALQLERSRELAILRALGMTQKQLGGLVVGQTALIGLFSGLAAIPLGLMMAWLLIEVINRRSFGWEMAATVDPAILQSSLLLALGAATLAGLYPAYRAASASPALAMREE